MKSRHESLEGRDDGRGGRDEDWAGDGARGTVAYSVELGHLMALKYSVELSTRLGVAYWDSSVRIVGIDNTDRGEVGGSGALCYGVDGAGVSVTERTE
jgi:hypothetical protein